MLDHDDILGRAGHAYAVSQRLAAAGPLDYLILVPTLRCNLSCSYCQVSRVNADRSGFDWRSEEHTSELQSLMRISYAVLCLKNKKIRPYHTKSHTIYND